MHNKTFSKIIAIFIITALLLVPVWEVQAGTALPPIPPGVKIPGADVINTALGLMKGAFGKKCPDWEEMANDVGNFILAQVFSKMGPVAAGLWFAKETGNWVGSKWQADVVEDGFSSYERWRNDFMQTEGLDPSGEMPESRWHNFYTFMRDIAASQRNFEKSISYVNRGDISSYLNNQLSSQEIAYGMRMMEFMHMAKTWRDQNLSGWDKVGDWFSDLIYGDPLPYSFDDFDNNCDKGGRSQVTVRASWDPNAVETSPPGKGEERWILPDTRIDFTVFFENDAEKFGEFTVAAEDIRIEMTLDTDIDPNSVEFGDSSYDNTEVAFNPETGKIIWTLPGINLPPNLNPPEGEGWVKFSASLKEGAASGTQITNQADIFFDFNPPITTDPVTLTVDDQPPTASMHPINGSPNAGNMTLNWEGTDNSGINKFTLYRSVNGSSLIPWQVTTEESLIVEAKAGTKYGFAVQAEDLVGLLSDTPGLAEISFTVQSNDQGDRSTDSANYLTIPGVGKLTGFERVESGFKVTEVERDSDMGVKIGKAFDFGAELTDMFRIEADYEVLELGKNVLLELNTDQTGALYRYDEVYKSLVPLKEKLTAQGRTISILHLGSYAVLLEDERTFKDVNSDHWAGNYIGALAKKGILNGFDDGSFRPEDPLTREQAAKLVALAAGILGQAENETFPDTKDRWSEVFISSALNAEVLTGYPDGAFHPDSHVTRAELVVMVLRALGIEASGKPKFADSQDHWAASYIAAGVKESFLTGYPDGTFRPNASITRAEAAKVICLAFDWLKRN